MLRWRDRILTALVWGGALLVCTMFLWVTGDILGHGLSRIHLDFLLTSPADAGRAGGILPILVSTGLVVLVCLIAVTPVALLAAVFLSESCTSSRVCTLLRRSLDVLAGMPSIVFGLFGAALFVGLFGFSILSGGLTLACMVLPLLVRTTEAALSAVPGEVRLGAAALGMSRTGVILRVLLPVAAPGVAVGLVLGIGRALAETAALVFTSGYVDRMPGSLLDSGRVLSIHILDLSMNVPGGDGNAYAAAGVLLALLLVINGAAGWLTRRWLGAGVTQGVT